MPAFPRPCQPQYILAYMFVDMRLYSPGLLEMQFERCQQTMASQRRRVHLDLPVLVQTRIDLFFVKSGAFETRVANLVRTQEHYKSTCRS